MYIINFLPRLNQNPWGDGPKFDIVFSAFIADETSVILFIDMLSRFEVTRFRNRGLPNVVVVGRKIFESRF